MEKNEYSTSDIHFAAYIQALDIPLKITDNVKQEKRKVLFVFDLPKDKIDTLKSECFGGSGEVKVQ